MGLELNQHEDLSRNTKFGGLSPSGNSGCILCLSVVPRLRDQKGRLPISPPINFNYIIEYIEVLYHFHYALNEFPHPQTLEALGLIHSNPFPFSPPE
jgi:hypothetical protein